MSTTWLRMIMLFLTFTKEIAAQFLYQLYCDARSSAIVIVVKFLRS